MAITVTSNEETGSMRQRRAEELLDAGLFGPRRGPDSSIFSPATRWRDGRAPGAAAVLPPVERAAGHHAISQLL
jgi:hypothetical protein